MTVAIISWITALFAFAAAITCFVYAAKSSGTIRLFVLFAGIVFLYYASIYTIAQYTNWYILRSGILSRTGIIMLSGLFIGLVVILWNRHEC